MKIKLIYIIWGLIFILFFVKAIMFLDPDFGWHYQMGKIISEFGVPKLDQFSYTMPNFAYVDHEWLTDVFIYKIYNTFGIFGLSFLWTLFCVTALWLSVNKIFFFKKYQFGSKNINIIKISMILLGSGLVFGQFGIRPQIVSWLFLSVLLTFLSYSKKNNLIKLLLPFLFLFWANLHGAFVIGLVIFGAVLLTRTIIFKKIIFIDWLLFLVSFLVTFINPYGINLWKEIINTFFNSALRSQIEEWIPAWTGLNICYPFFAVLTTVLIFRFKKFFLKEDLFIFTLLLLMSFSAIINIPLFTIVAIPFLIYGVIYLEKESKLFKLGGERFKKVLIGFTTLSVFLFLFTLFFSYRNTLAITEDSYYPKNAINYISKNLPDGEIFSIYNWGGYLIWKLPQKKVFVDGRMAHWPNILEYQSNIILGKINYVDEFSKYKIQMVIWPKKDKDDIFIDRIKKDGWKVVYSDNVSQILVKN